MGWWCGCYFSLNELPFSVAENTEQLVENIANFNQSEYINKLNEFYKKVGLYDDGNASKRVVDVIEQIITDKYYKNL